MNCSNCGAPLTPGATSCPNCGIQFAQPVPAYYAQPQPTKKGIPVLGWVLGCGGLGCLSVVAFFAAILFPVFAQAREKARQTSCASNERQMGLAMLQYAQDYDNVLPGATTWADATYPYIKANMVCPDVVTGGAASNGTGYAYNSRLGNAKYNDIADPASTAVVYDSSATAHNASDPVTSLPNPGRHTGKNNVTFLDGSVKAIDPPPGK